MYSRHTENLPAVLPEEESLLDSLAPVAYSAVMLAAGAALLVAKPRLGHVPDPIRNGDLPRRGLRRAAQVGRDNIRVLAPTNVTDAIGRSLLIGGVALLAARVLDVVAGRDD